jgi:phosphoenolpyruvate carboxykinase (ATP)
LTADAFGVMPPIAKLNKESAMYHFMSGYTSKLAGTERGITEPKETFSQCFGAPFMPLHAKLYADMLGRRIDQYHTKVFLVNTGWSGGPYGVGRRINLTYTRAMVRAALTGSLYMIDFVNDGIFNLEIPVTCPGVPTEILDPKSTWPDREKYESSARRLARLFVKNFEKFGKMPKEIQKAGPAI